MKTKCIICGTHGTQKSYGPLDLYFTLKCPQCGLLGYSDNILLWDKEETYNTIKRFHAENPKHSGVIALCVDSYNYFCNICKVDIQKAQINKNPDLVTVLINGREWLK